MKLLEAQQMVANLKETLTDPYWGDIYCLLQNALLAEEHREWDVYIEYHGNLNLGLVAGLISSLGELTYVLATPTRQIIIW